MREGAASERDTSTLSARGIGEPRATARITRRGETTNFGLGLPWLALARGISSSEVSKAIVAGRNRVGRVVFGEAQRGAVKGVRSANLGDRVEVGERLWLLRRVLFAAEARQTERKTPNPSLQGIRLAVERNERWEEKRERKAGGRRRERQKEIRENKVPVWGGECPVSEV